MAEMQIRGSQIKDGVIKPDGSIPFTADQSLGSHKLTNVTDPSAAQDAATKAYVDATINGLQWKQSVRAATTANLAALSAPQTIDAISCIAGDRVLVKDQTTGADNGIYVVAAGAWTRATDFDANAEVKAGAAMVVDEGTTNGDKFFILTTNDPITVGVTSLAFSGVTSGGGSGGTTVSNYFDGLVLLAEQVASASATLDFASRNVAGQSGNLIQSDYDEYVIELVNVVPATSAANMLMLVSTNAGVSYDTGSNYQWARFLMQSGATSSGGSTSDTSISLAVSLNNTSSKALSGNFKMTGALQSAVQLIVEGQSAFYASDGTWNNYSASGTYKTLASVNALRFLMSSGNIASGTIRIYGLTKQSTSLQQIPAHGLVLLHSQTVAAAATLDVVSRNIGTLSGAIFQSDYDEYVIELINIQVGTNDAGVLGRVSTDGGASYSATTYARTFQYGAANNTTSGGGATGATSWDISGNQSNASTNALVGFLKLYNPLSATLYKQMVGNVAWGHTGVDWISTEYSLIWKTITAINAFRLLPSTGTLTGTVRVYGVVKDATYPVSSIQTGTHATRPTAGNAGRIYLPSDGYTIARDTGSAWATFGPVYPFTAPPTGVWSWLNQGTATISETKDALTLFAPANGNTNDFKMREKVTPATPYTMTAFLKGGIINKNNHQWGVFLRQSGAGTGQNRIMAFFNGQAAAAVAVPGLDVYVADIANATSAYGTFYRAVNIMSAVEWFRIADDGANIAFSVSTDGQNWVTILTQSRLTYLLQGPDRIGFFYHPSNAATPNLDGYANVLSWKEA